MNVFMVAKDVGPSNALNQILVALQGQGIVFHFLRQKLGICSVAENEKIIREVINEPMDPIDVILAGMSSSPELAKEELSACETAVKNGVPLALFADTFGAWGRPWFEPYREVASALFVVSPAEAEKARELFPHTRIIASGNPTWEDFFFPKYTREEVRQKLGIGDEQKMILAPGGKCLAQNMLLFGGVIGASDAVQRLKVVLTLHPADPNPSEIYADLVKYSRNPVSVIPKQMFSGSEIIPGCDVVVQSGSTIGIEAACQRKPVIEYLTYVGLGNWERQTGSRTMETIELGIAKEVLASSGAGVGHLAYLIDGLTHPQSNLGSGLLRQQEKVFPQPAQKGAAVKTIISALQELCR